MCCSLEGQLKCGVCEGWKGFGKHRENSEKNGRQHSEQTLSRQGYCLGSTSERLRWDLFYNRLLQAPEDFRMWKPPINVKVISLRCLRKSVGVLPRGSLCFVTWTCQMTFLKDAELRGKDRARPCAQLKALITKRCSFESLLWPLVTNRGHKKLSNALMPFDSHKQSGSQVVPYGQN